MKPAIILGLVGLALAACTPGEETAKADPLRADCDVLASDPEGQAEFADMGTDSAGFCDCLVKYINAKPDDEKAKMTLVLNRVGAAMTETGEGAEDVVGAMMGEITTSENGADLAAGIALVGDAIDEIGDGFGETGACPVA